MTKPARRRYWLDLKSDRASRYIFRQPVLYTILGAPQTTPVIEYHEGDVILSRDIAEKILDALSKSLLRSCIEAKEILEGAMKN